jgi:hypothetical protein
MAALLDTCILIGLLRRDDRAERMVLALPVRPYVCAVSEMELNAGARSQGEERRIEAVLSAFHWAPIDRNVFQRAGGLLRHFRASHGLDIPDALIAAAAEHHGLDLATLNVKHFPMFKRLKAAY